MQYENSVRPKLLVPVKGSQSICRLTTWLSANPQVWNAELRLIHVLEPQWLNDIPYSPLQALRRLDEQDRVIAEVQREFNALAVTVQNQFSNSLISAHVVNGISDPGAIIVDFADRWHVNCILIFRSHQGPIREFLRGRLISRILRSATCAVQVIQSPQEHVHKKDQFTVRFFRRFNVTV